MSQEQRNPGRRHSLQALGLSDRERPRSLQLVPQFARQALNPGVVETGIKQGALFAAGPLNVFSLPIQIDRVFGVCLDLSLDRLRQGAEMRP